MMFFKVADVFRFQIPSRFVFGNGAIESIGDEAELLFGTNKKVMIVTDEGIVKAGLLEAAIRSLEKKGYRILVFDKILPEPPVSVVLEGVKVARAEQAEIIFGIGGGSAIDSAKAISVMVPYDGEIHDLLGEQKVKKPGLPKMFVPTTAGTGAEISNTFVLTDDIKTGEKVSSQSIYTYGNLALVDPVLTANLPQPLTAQCGVDALAHCLESFVGLRANPLSDMFAFRAIELIANNLRKAYSNGPKDPEARYAMCLGVCLGTMAVRTTGTGCIHCTGYPLATRYHLSHGVAIALMMPAVTEYNLIGNPEKFAAVAQALGENISGLSTMDAAKRAVTGLKKLISDVGLASGLRGIGVKEEEFPNFAKIAVTNYPRLASNNPRPMTEKDAVEVYRMAY
jgi:alcohol dehydrogenase